MAIYIRVAGTVQCADSVLADTSSPASNNARPRADIHSTVNASAIYALFAHSVKQYPAAAAELATLCIRL
jgi:hypothetical protein